MKKFFINICIVIVIIFVLDSLVGKMLHHFYFKEVQGSGQDAHITYSMDSTRANIVVFGNSTALFDYMPDVFQDSLRMSFYTTGVNGAPNSFVLAMLKSVLKRYTPDVIILSLDYRNSAKDEQGNNDNDRLSALLPYYSTHKEIRNILGLRGPYEKSKLLLSDIYPFNSKIFSIVKGNSKFFVALERKKSVAPPSVKTGHVDYNQTMDSKIDTVTVTSNILDSANADMLYQFLSLAKKSSAKVFVCYTPVFEKYNTKPQEMISCKSMCRQQNIPFEDFSEDTLFLNNSKYFGDPHHLNTKGASVFSEILAHKIKSYISALNNSNDVKKQ